MLLVTLFAAAGGLAKYILQRRHGQILSWGELSGQIFLAFFAGAIMFYLVMELGGSINLRILLCALSGFTARKLLTTLNVMFLDKVKILIQNLLGTSGNAITTRHTNTQAIKKNKKKEK